jgi:hypothetical protein
VEETAPTLTIVKWIVNRHPVVAGAQPLASQFLPTRQGRPMFLRHAVCIPHLHDNNYELRNGIDLGANRKAIKAVEGINLEKSYTM